MPSSHPSEVFRQSGSYAVGGSGSVPDRYTGE